MSGKRITEDTEVTVKLTVAECAVLIVIAEGVKFGNHDIDEVLECATVAREGAIKLREAVAPTGVKIPKGGLQ